MNRKEEMKSNLIEQYCLVEISRGRLTKFSLKSTFQTKEHVWFVCIVVNGASMQMLYTVTQAMTVVQIAILRTILL